MFGIKKNETKNTETVNLNANAAEYFIKPAEPIRFNSVEFRDGQQSLLATRVKTEDMLPILPEMDEIGYDSMEMWGGATFDVCIRYLNEDPWDRIRAFKKYMKKTPLKIALRGQNLIGYKPYPDDVVELFVRKAADAGIDIFLIFDGLQDHRNCLAAINAAKKAGKIVEGSLQYAISPFHTLDYYVKTAKEIEASGVDAIHVEDMAGLLAPKVSYDLIRALKKELQIPVHLHCHSTGGMAEAAYWEAIRAGVDVLDVCVSTLAQGPGHPPIESFIAATEGGPRDSGLNLSKFESLNKFFLQLRTKYKEFESKMVGVDIGCLQHQIPGGMLTNLESQLKVMNILDRLPEVLTEAAIVRKDFGYPALATPSSQMVGAQATANVLTGERYKIISRETKDLLRGMYGTPPGPVSEELLRKALGDEKPITCRPADLMEPILDKMKQEAGELVRTDEDLLTYTLFPTIASEFLKRKYQL